MLTKVNLIHVQLVLAGPIVISKETTKDANSSPCFQVHWNVQLEQGIQCPDGKERTNKDKEDYNQSDKHILHFSSP
jgi:hypothetical protein